MNDYPDYDDETAEAAARDNDDYAAYMAHLEQESAPDCPFCGHPVDVLTDGIVCSNCEVTWPTLDAMRVDADALAAQGWAL